MYVSATAEPEDDDVKAERLEKLAGFQLNMIRHAMKCESTKTLGWTGPFSLTETPSPVPHVLAVPNAKRIVYSTCSIHKEEDEEVVMKALESPEAVEYGWSIAPRSQVLPKWERRGRVEATNGDAGEYRQRWLEESLGSTDGGK